MKPLSSADCARAQTQTVIGVHSTHRDDTVHVAQSQFLKAKGLSGNGLYASRRLARGEVFMEYVGKVISVKEAKRRKIRTYMFNVKSRGRVIFVVDSLVNHLSSAAKYANRADKTSEQNFNYQQFEKRIFLVARKPIAEGTELLGWYGKDRAGHSA